MYEDIKIKVLGVGGGGSNTTDFIVNSKMSNVETIAINTDAQALEQSRAATTVHIGKTLTKGLGAGAIPEIGRAAAEESRDEIIRLIQGADIVFVASGMGGGTGTGAAPYIASIAKDLGILTIAIITKPFGFEGRTRMQKALEGIQKLKSVADVTVVIPNQKLIQEHEDKFIEEAFTIPDEVLKTAVESLITMLNSHSQVGSSIDLNSLIATLTDQGLAVMGMGESGDEQLSELENLHLALDAATSSSILDISVKGATKFIVLIGGNINYITPAESQYVTDYLYEKLGYDEFFVVPSFRDESNFDEFQRSITIIATGYPQSLNDSMMEMENNEY